VTSDGKGKYSKCLSKAFADKQDRLLKVVPGATPTTPFNRMRKILNGVDYVKPG